MKLNIQTLKNLDELNFDEEIQVSLKDLKLSSDTKDYMVRVQGKVSREGDLYTVQGELDLTLKLLCDRCMAEALAPVHSELFCEFSSNERQVDENEDINQVTKSSIDLSEVILEGIAMNLPTKVLCNEDCKGMCTGCGANFNHEACKCEKIDIDPRLEQLKDIFCGNSKK